MQGMTLENGKKVKTYYDDGGGAIGTSGALKLDNMAFVNNQAGSGGAIGTRGTVDVTNSSFSGNSATVTLAGNSPGSGWAIYEYAGVLTLAHDTFSGNTADGQGGAID